MGVVHPPFPSFYNMHKPRSLDLNGTQTTKLMHIHGNRIFPSLVTLLLYLGSFGFSFGQTEEADDEDIFELSPFNVDETEDVGYLATSSLAGTRINTNLKDVAGAIQVLTQEFLDDTAATNARDVLVYTTNTEVGGIGGNFGDPSGGAALNFQESTRNPIAQTRIRGLASADLARQYFITDIPFDSYNTERITINRGPNSILFGLGSPGGLVNNGLSRARFIDSSELEFRYGSFDSHRGTFDFNRVVGENENFAIRVAGLYDEERWQQRFSYERDERIYTDFAWTPFENTMIRFNYENGEINANRPPVSAPLSNVPRWIEEGMVAEWDVATNDYRDRFVLTGNEALKIGYFGVNVRTAAVFPDHTSSEPSLPGAQWMNVPNMRDDGRFIAHPAFETRNAMGRFMRVSSLTDDSFFDFRNEMLMGPSNKQEEDFDALNFSIEQTFLDKKAGIEIAYDEQSHLRFRNERNAGWLGGNFIAVDLGNVYRDERENPNYLRPYTLSGQQGKTYNWSDRETVRATAYYNLDFTENDGWSKWLGRHVFTGLFNKQTFDRRMEFYRDVGIDDRATDFLIRSFSSNITANRRNFNNVHYIGPRITGAANAKAYGLTYPDRPLQEANVIIWNPETQQNEEQTFGLVPDIPTNGTMNRDEISSYAVIAQSFLFDDNLVFTTGWRQDEADAWVSPPVARTDDRRAIFSSITLPESPTGSVKDDVFSWGVVGHLPDSWEDRLGFGLSGHYNSSENFQPEGARVNVFGDPVGAPSGITQEYGFSLDFLDGRASMRINWFETSVVNNSATGIGVATVASLDQLTYDSIDQLIIDGINPPEFADLYELAPQAYQDVFNYELFTVDGIRQMEFTSPGNVVATTDFVAEGMEIEAIFNPLPNWRIMVNVAQQQTIRSNTAKAFSELLELRQPVWDRVADFWQDDRLNIKIGENVKRRILDPTRAILLLDGSPATEQREWRANLITSYDFAANSSLKGFGIGGAYRWEDSVAIGSPTIFDNDLQDDVLDVKNPYFGPKEDTIDAWVSYERLIFDKQVNWRLRLNIRNLLDEDDLIPVAQDPDFTYVGMRIRPGRTYTLSSRFEF